MLSETLVSALARLVPALPAVFGAAVLALMLPRLFGCRAGESFTYGVARFAFAVALMIGALLAVAVASSHGTPRMIDSGRWFAVGEERFEVLFALDSPGLAYGIFSLVLVALVAAFSRRYLHREAGFHRFYALLLLFAMGLVLVSFAGSLDMLLIGWELVGVSSTLLIAFFNERPKPVRNALRAFTTYRMCDVGLVLAILGLHANHGAADFTLTTPDSVWLTLPRQAAGLSELVIGLGILLAAAGKSAQVPFSGWLPRAMEGPTPSSAVFYGALSVHLGPFLLLRCAPVLHASWPCETVVVVVGLATIVHGALVGRVQTDIKSMLAYGSVTQVGLITVEIGLGLHVLALVHIIGHAGYRTLQILRAPSLLHDRHHLEQMLGHHVPHTVELPDGGGAWFSSPAAYRHALERGGLDALLKERVIGQLLGCLRRLDAFEQDCATRLARRALTLLARLRRVAGGKANAS